MSRRITFTLSLCALLAASQAHALDVTINMNGFLAGSGLYVSGPGGYTSPFVFGSPGASYTATAITTDGAYNVDFFHNSGPEGSDFGFTVAGGAVTAVGTNGAGHVMHTTFNANTINMNAVNVVYNANSGNTGNFYYLAGATPFINNSAPLPVTVVPGTYSVDNLYNSGSGNEDYRFTVDGTGATSAASGNGNGPVAFGIPNSEYATFAGNNVNVRSELVHIIIDSSSVMGAVAPNFTILNDTGPGLHREFDMLMPIGSAGIRFNDFGAFTVVDSNIQMPDGTDMEGQIGTNDFAFIPKLRYDGASNATGFFWDDRPGLYKPGAFAEVTGFFDGNVNPLTLTVQAFLPALAPPPPPVVPEPATFALAAMAALGLVVGARRRVRK